MTEKLSEGQRFYCPVCGLEVVVNKEGEPVVPLMCCGIDMVPVEG